LAGRIVPQLWLDMVVKTRKQQKETVLAATDSVPTSPQLDGDALSQANDRAPFSPLAHGETPMQLNVGDKIIYTVEYRIDPSMCKKGRVVARQMVCQEFHVNG
jgi:hypothetical protein